MAKLHISSDLDDIGSNGEPPEALRTLAKETIDYLEKAVEAAAGELSAGTQPRADALASLNTFTDKAVDTLSTIGEEKRRHLQMVMSVPASARLEVRSDAGENLIIYITPGAAPWPSVAGARLASYYSPIGRLAALRVGDEIEAPNGRAYKLLGRAKLNPERVLAGWDSRNTIVDRQKGKPWTVVSLRDLLPVRDLDGEVLAFLESELSRDGGGENVFEGLRRSVLKRIGVREQSLLDEYQDEIFRLPLDSQVVILGPPGSGKTTTLIKRLGMKLDAQALEPEKPLIDLTLAGPAGHGASWVMFSPSELLRQYVKEAFARERIPASDHQMVVWEQFRQEIARNRLNLLQSGNSSGGVLRLDLRNLQNGTIINQTGWYDDFDAWQQAAFWSDLREQAERVASSEDAAIANLGQRLLRPARSGADTNSARVFVEFRSLSAQVTERASAINKAIDDKLGHAFARRLQLDRQLIEELRAFIATLGEEAEDADDSEADLDDDDDGVFRPEQLSNRAVFDAYKQAVRAHARALVAGRKVGPRTRNGRLLEWLGEKIPEEAELRQLGADAWLVTSLRRLANPLRGYIRGIPNRYRRFRRQSLTDGRWYERAPRSPSDLSPLELDLLVLAVLRAGQHLLQERSLSVALDEPSLQSLKAVRALMRTQVLVDEATDFSPLQLACMVALADPAANSFIACGDFNQRITTWGVRSREDLKWIFPNLDIRTIKITYRHTRQLNDFGHRLAKLTDEGSEAAALPEHVDNEGVEPVLGLGLTGLDLVNWLRDRIFEIDRINDSLPTIAVLVNDEEQVQPLAKQLDEVLGAKNIRCVACLGGQARGNDGDVRVFDVQHIKGLEFEGVFFVGIDELAARQPDLFDKFLYVGATRAAVYLGLTTDGPALPERLKSLHDAFGQRWS